MQLETRNEAGDLVPMKRLLFAPLLLVVAGCASPPSVGRLPPPSDFAKPVYALHNNYPDLKKLDPDEERRWWIGQGKMPYAEGLLEAWGEPTFPVVTG